MDITLTFGKYCGQKLSQVPVSYVRWLSEQPTIMGKRDIPQAAKTFLQSASAGVSSNEKECCSCRRSIRGEAVPMQERTAFGSKTTAVRTKYLCVSCARSMAEEE